MLVLPERSAHFYAYDRNNDAFRPAYSVPLANGKGMRSTTLADARKLGLCYSVTRVCNCVNKPALTSWLQSQAIMAALTLPRLDGETVDAFAARVVEDMGQQSKTARDFGSLLHSQIEADISGKLDVPDWTCEAHLTAVRAWMKEHCTDYHGTELIVGDASLGVAGKLDLDCTLKDFGRCIVDFKTQRVKNGKPTFYPEWALQLAVYRWCRQRELIAAGERLIDMRLLSVVIDTTPEAPQVFAHWWPDDIDYLALFIGLLNWLCFSENYDPRKLKEQQHETAPANQG